MVCKAERYRWWNAAAHCGLQDDGVLTQKAKWGKQFEQYSNWSAGLAEGENVDQLSVLRRNINKGLPCGNEGFIKKLEKLTGKVL